MGSIVGLVVAVLGVILGILLPIASAVAIIFLLYVALGKVFFKKQFRVKRQIYVGSVLIILITPLFYVFLFFLMEKAMCGTHVLPKVFSPQHTFSAQVKEHDCGATTGFSTWVELTKNSQVFTVLSGDIYPKSLELSWQNDNTLNIIHQADVCPLREKPHLSLDAATKEQVKIVFIDRCQR